MTTRIEDRFASLKAEGRPALVTFLMAGDPDGETAFDIMQALPAAGSDLIELGMPFSDPMADGPAIQKAGLRALNGGETLRKTLATVARFRQGDQATPIILMGYFNPIYVYGVDAFVTAALEAGVDGLIVVDLPPEMDDELCLPALAKGLNFIRLATPTTDDKRLPAVLANTSGFVYAITNPVRFTSASMLEILGMTQGGKNYQEISVWLRRMTFTGIESEGVVFLAGKKKYARDMFHVFQRSVAVGEVLEDGTVAQENYVWLSEWQLDNLNNRHTLPINYDVYKKLQLHIGKALLPLLQLWFYASREQYTEKRYTQLCSLLGIQHYPAVSRIRQQIGPSLDELTRQQFLNNWEIGETADGTDYKLRLWAGSAFVSSADLRQNTQPKRLLLADQNEVVKALVDRGVREDKARNLLLNLPDDQLAMDQIEWADAEIARKAKTSAAIHNVAGFLIYVLQANHPVPATFMTTRRRRLMEAAREQVEKGKMLSKPNVSLSNMNGKSATKSFWRKIPTPILPRTCRRAC